MSRPAERWLEVAATLLLALATVATAWAAYQARQWTGEQSQAYSKGTAARITENRTAALADRQVQIDVATFIQWLDARAQHDEPLADFYRRRFRAEFQPAFNAWLASKERGTPFVLPQYKLAAQAQADDLERTAAAASQRAKDANAHADNYMLAVVLCATTLFLVGISAKVESGRAILLGIGGATFLGALIWIASLPVQLTT